jgi:hypothetical protein
MPKVWYERTFIKPKGYESSFKKGMPRCLIRRWYKKTSMKKMGKKK